MIHVHFRLNDFDFARSNCHKQINGIPRSLLICWDLSVWICPSEVYKRDNSTVLVGKLLEGLKSGYSRL